MNKLDQAAEGVRQDRRDRQGVPGHRARARPALREVGRRAEGARAVPERARRRRRTTSTSSCASARRTSSIGETEKALPLLKQGEGAAPEQRRGEPLHRSRVPEAGRPRVGRGDALPAARRRARSEQGRVPPLRRVGRERGDARAARSRAHAASTRRSRSTSSSPMDTGSAASSLLREGAVERRDQGPQARARAEAGRASRRTRRSPRRYEQKNDTAAAMAEWAKAIAGDDKQPTWR